MCWFAELWCEYECGLPQRRWCLPSGLYYTHIHPPMRGPSVCYLMACWYLGCLGLGQGRGQGHEQQAPPCMRLCLFLPLLQFPRCPGYLCHGNCASLSAQTQILLLVSLVASMMTQQLLQRSSFHGFSDTPCSSDKVVFSHSLLHPDLNTKQTKIMK